MIHGRRNVFLPAERKIYPRPSDFAGFGKRKELASIPSLPAEKENIMIFVF